jgi:hypothetical protein
MPHTVQRVDAADLDRVAGDPQIKSNAIAKHLGLSRSALYYLLARNRTLWEVYAMARKRAGIDVSQSYTPKKFRRGLLSADEILVLEAISTSETHLYGDIRQVVIDQGLRPERFSVLMYDLENESHEIESHQIGLTTQYFIRDRDEQSAKSKAPAGEFNTPFSAKAPDNFPRRREMEAKEAA